jgi:hypothetical protein
MLAPGVETNWPMQLSASKPGGDRRGGVRQPAPSKEHTREPKKITRQSNCWDNLSGL